MGVMNRMIICVVRKTNELVCVCVCVCVCLCRGHLNSGQLNTLK